MRTYIYRCSACDRTHEVKHRMSEDPSVHCLECNGAMHRVPQVVHFTAHLFGDSEGNRWHGSQKDKLEMQRKYSDENRAKELAKAQEKSLVQAQSQGADMLTPKSIEGPSLMDMAKQEAQRRGVRVNG